MTDAGISSDAAVTSQTIDRSFRVRDALFAFRGKSSCVCVCVCSSFAGALSPWCGDVWKNPLARNMLLKLLTQRSCQQEVRHWIQQFIGTNTKDCDSPCVHWEDCETELSSCWGPHEIKVGLIYLMNLTILFKATCKVYLFCKAVCVQSIGLQKHYRLMYL